MSKQSPAPYTPVSGLPPIIIPKIQTSTPTIQPFPTIQSIPIIQSFGTNLTPTISPLPPLRPLYSNPSTISPLPPLYSNPSTTVPPLPPLTVPPLTVPPLTVPPLTLPPLTLPKISDIKLSRPVLEPIQGIPPVPIGTGVLSTITLIKVEKPEVKKKEETISVVPIEIAHVEPMGKFITDPTLLAEYAISRQYLDMQMMKSDVIVDLGTNFPPGDITKVYHIPQVLPNGITIFNEAFKFEPKDMYLTATSPVMKYKSRRGDEAKATAWGQRKLGMALIQFLTIFWDKSKVPDPVVVYAGAAEGRNIAMAIFLFPEVKEWHLYDPNPFNVNVDMIVEYMRINYKGMTPFNDVKKKEEISKKLIIHTGDNGWFSDDVAKIYSQGVYVNRVFFLSDIRSADSTFTNEEFEIGVWKDMIAQSNWHKIIKPVKSQLKFRLPYTRETEDDLRVIKYLSGTVYKQMYEKATSTEARLVPDDLTPDGIAPEVSWNYQRYESAMFYHNVIVRTQFFYLNPLYDPMSSGSLTEVYPPELLNDYDSIYETFTWKLYLMKRNLPVNTEKVISLNKGLTFMINWGSKKQKTMSDLRK
jgi:hypothetical protein